MNDTLPQDTTSTAAARIPHAVRPSRRERLDLRAVSLVLGGSVAAGALVVALVPEHMYLVALALYQIACELVNLPLEPALLFVAKHHSPLAVTVYTSIGGLIGGVLDYWILGPLLNLRAVRSRYEGKPWYLASAQWFGRAPFLSLFFAALTPVPFILFKLFAIAAGYSHGRYLLALTVARIPRFYALAWFGMEIPIPDWLLALAMAVLVAAFVWAHVRDRVRSPAV